MEIQKMENKKYKPGNKKIYSYTYETGTKYEIRATNGVLFIYKDDKLVACPGFSDFGYPEKKEATK